MIEFIFAFVAFVLIITAMAVGVIFSNKPIKGSCGGLNALGMKKGCEICGGDDEICEKENEKKSGKQINADKSGFYDATKKL